MSIKTFKDVAARLPPWTSVLLRGGHGIGKSQVIRQVVAKIRRMHVDGKTPKNVVNVDMSKYKDLKDFFKVIDRRLSQTTEGDIVGLPSTDGECTRFNPPDWYKLGCDIPIVIFLDELNRATPEVMQAAFQIILDRELNGQKLHPETRVYSAINTGSSYTVNEVDPALIDRFFVIDLVTDEAEWCEWASDPDPEQGGNLDPLFPDFIMSAKRAKGGGWLYPPKDADIGERTTSPRSWVMAHNALKYADLLDKPTDSLFYSICIGFLGVEAAVAFRDYAKDVGNRITGEDVVNHYLQDKLLRAKVKRRKQGALNDVIDKVADYVTGGNIIALTEVQGKNIEQLIKDLPDELKVSLWGKLTASGVARINLAKSVHTYCAAAVLGMFGVPFGKAGVGVTPNTPSLFAAAPKSNTP